MEVKESSIARFFANSISGSVLLIFMTVLAIVFANTDLDYFYNYFINQTVAIELGGHDILHAHGNSMNVLGLVNDGLMAIFFFAIGLEIKREILIGELSNFRKALLPVIAAIGGMIVPVLIYHLFAKGTPAAAGLAIPMATDIAFSLGVLSLLGKRVPISLKVFLTALAVADDLGGILVIAIFYSQHIEISYLLISVIIMLILYAGGKRGIKNAGFYVTMAVLMWFMFYHAGVHPTIAGVISAFFVPARAKINSFQFIAKMKDNIHRFPPITQINNGVILLNEKQTSILHRLKINTNKVISPMQHLEDFLHPIVAFFIVPLFAFVNAGIVFEGISMDTILSKTAMGVFVGLIGGKFLGIFSFSYLAIKSKLVSLPTGINMKQLAAVAIIGGIGFTVSLFIANLAFQGNSTSHELLNEAKIGIIGASIFAGVMGYLILKKELPAYEKETIIEALKEEEEDVVEGIKQNKA